MSEPEVNRKPKRLSKPDERLLAQTQRVLVSEQTPPSPCVSICRMSPKSGLCEGCWRTLDEIVAWSKNSAQDKREVWHLIHERLSIHALLGRSA